jgi:hypothetical protein
VAMHACWGPTSQYVAGETPNVFMRGIQPWFTSQFVAGERHQIYSWGEYNHQGLKLRKYFRGQVPHEDIWCLSQATYWLVNHGCIPLMNTFGVFPATNWLVNHGCIPLIHLVSPATYWLTTMIY